MAKNYKQLNANTYKKWIPLEQIYAIQLISITNMYRKTLVIDYGYELNLVLNSKERINVIYENSLICSNSNNLKKQIRKDAEELSRFLGVPLWDAIDYKNI